MTDDTTAAALAFIEAINSGGIGAMTGLMSENHRFIDALGVEIRGRSAMRKAWIEYSVMIPDYRITVDQVFVSGTTAAIFGRASGTFSPDGKLHPRNHWEIPAAWRVVVRDGKIAEWQVYADNEPVRTIIARQEAT